MNNYLKRINLDISNKCRLMCPGCNRQKYYDGNIPGRDITLREMQMIVDHFDEITFCGQVSDPLYHKNFYSLLKMCENKQVHIFHAANLPSKKDYLKYFLLSKGKNISWFFALDGLPSESHKYRKRQDGELLFEVMKTCASMGIDTTWEYLVFKYNESHVDECRKLAHQYGIKFNKVISTRWFDEWEEYNALDLRPISYAHDALQLDPEQNKDFLKKISKN